MIYLWTDGLEEVISIDLDNEADEVEEVEDEKEKGIEKEKEKLVEEREALGPTDQEMAEDSTKKIEDPQGPDTKVMYRDSLIHNSLDTFRKWQLVVLQNLKT